MNSSDLPRTWYFAARSRDVGPGAIIPLDLGNRSLVLFRSADGKAISALSAHCSHLGAHLRHGEVIGDRIRCALHHREFDGGGMCRALPGGAVSSGTPCQTAYPVVENHGAIFVCPDSVAPFQFPWPHGDTAEAGDWVSCVSKPRSLPVPWRAIITNAFDIDHLTFVHKRALVERPKLSRPEPLKAVLEYRSRVIGAGPSDIVMRFLADREVRVKMTCHGGTLMIVESAVGSFRTFMIFSIHPMNADSKIHSVIGLRRRGPLAVDRLTLRVAQWLFLSFLGRDVRVLEDFDLRRPAPPQTFGDQVLCQLAEFLDALPGLARDTDRPFAAASKSR